MVRLSTGVPGLDEVLHGGLPEGCCALVTGAAGTGKTTLALQFLSAGVMAGEGGVYFTFEEFPEQIYRDAAAFGWDLPAMEQSGKLQVVCLSPDMFLQEASAVAGLLDELQSEVGLRRAVVDSLNLLHLASDRTAPRQDFYMIRNAFRRLGVSALFLHEEASAADRQDEFVADTVVRLSLDSIDGYRLRHLEVTKHRGSSFLSGKHVMVFGKEGVRILAPLGRIPVPIASEYVPTGLAKLDECLGGGMPRGTTWAFNVNSKSHYRYLVEAIKAAHLKQGYGLIAGRAAFQSPEMSRAFMSLYGIDLLELGKEGRWLELDFADRPVAPEYQPYVIQLDDQSQGEAERAIYARLRGAEGNARYWFFREDLNTLLLKVGEDSVRQHWPKTMNLVATHGHTLVGLCNFDEMGASLASFVQRTATGVIRIWSDGRYQYLQVMKAPNGRVSEPMVVEYTTEPPFMTLW